MITFSALLAPRRGMLIAATLAFAAASQAAGGPEEKFLAENDAAMSKMMTDMAVRPSGDVDRDFVAMMVPHHQGAIDMAQIELRYGHNETLRRMAQEIIVDQTQEIAAMRLAIGEAPNADDRGTAKPADKATMKHGAMPMPKAP